MDVPTSYHASGEGTSFTCPACGAAVDDVELHTKWHEQLAELAAAVQNEARSYSPRTRCNECGGAVAESGGVWHHQDGPARGHLAIPGGIW